MVLHPRERLQAFADEQGLNHAGLAKLLGCAQPSVTRILAGSTKKARRGVGMELGAKIERATADWPGGQIMASEWSRGIGSTKSKLQRKRRRRERGVA